LTTNTSEMCSDLYGTSPPPLLPSNTSTYGSTTKALRTSLNSPSRAWSSAIAASSFSTLSSPCAAPRTQRRRFVASTASRAAPSAAAHAARRSAVAPRRRGSASARRRPCARSSACCVRCSWRRMSVSWPGCAPASLALSCSGVFSGADEEEEEEEEEDGSAVPGGGFSASASASGGGCA
jgi:hypothetical protein